jgi:hypothetical protein
VEVHKHGQHLGAGDPVDHRVMHLHVQRLTSTGHTMDQVALPQRVLAAQRGLGQSGHLLGELFIGAGCGQTDLPDVMLQVRCRRVHPVGQVEPQGHLPQTPAQRFDQVQAAADQRADLLHREATAECSGGIEDGHDAHVGRHRRGFRVEELGIQRRELADQRIRLRRPGHAGRGAAAAWAGLAGGTSHRSQELGQRVCPGQLAVGERRPCTLGDHPLVGADGDRGLVSAGPEPNCPHLVGTRAENLEVAVLSRAHPIGVEHPTQDLRDRAGPGQGIGGRAENGRLRVRSATDQHP